MVGDRTLPHEAVGAGRRSSPPAPPPRTTSASGERRRPPTDPVIVRRRVRVWGSVQGVFFRATCAREASRRGLAGWVRNVADGSVEAVFEGEAEAVDAMTAWCRRGPRGARVDGVEAAEEPPEGREGFEITG